LPKRSDFRTLFLCASGMFTGYRVEVPNERYSAYH